MNISENQVQETLKNTREVMLLKARSIKKHNQGVKFRNFIRKQK